MTIVAGRQEPSRADTAALLLLASLAGISAGCVPCLVPCGGDFFAQGSIESSSETPPECELQLSTLHKNEDVVLIRRPVQGEFRQRIGMAWTRQRHTLRVVCDGEVLASQVVRYRHSVLRENPVDFGELKVTP